MRGRSSVQTWSSRVNLYLKKLEGEWLLAEAEYQYPEQLAAED